jgi:hypothetical protein
MLHSFHFSMVRDNVLNAAYTLPLVIYINASQPNIAKNARRKRLPLKAPHSTQRSSFMQSDFNLSKSYENNKEMEARTRQAQHINNKVSPQHSLRERIRLSRTPQLSL